ncbi:TRAP transporter substrate-binding protein DctP [Desulfocurvus sp. DL9XJH121]
MSTVYMNTHPTVVNAWTPWFKQMEELTGGDISLSYFNPNTLCPSKELFDATKVGAVGVGGNGQGLNPGKFPLSGVLELPGMAPSAECGALAFWELYQTHPDIQAEYTDIHVLWMWASATYQLHTIKQQVRTLEDLKGMKIVVWNRASADIMKFLGANPVQISPSDSYLALERGMADGVFCPLAPIVSYKISDAAHYTTICDLLLNPFWAGMGHDVWNSLSDKERAAFEQTTGQKMAKASGVTLDQGAVRDAATLRKQEHGFYVLPDKERKRWIDATGPMRENWVKEMESLGHKNARQLLEDMTKLCDKYAPTTGRGYQQ